MEDYLIRKMTRKELDIAVEWAAREGWNPGLHDADIFWNTDPDGFIALEKDGEMIGSGSVVSYSGKFGFMGFFIVKSQYRGHGLGTELWNYRRDFLLGRLDKEGAIGMDGVFNMQEFYAKGGFKFSHRDLRMEGVIPSKSFSSNIVQISYEDIDQITLFDTKFFGFDRRNFLEGWLKMPESISYKFVENSQIKGYGTIRKCRKGYKIGPLFAEDYSYAYEIFLALCQFADGDIVYLDVPEINENGMKLAQAYGMKEMFGCARMYYGKAPELPYESIYGITTFELG